MEELAHPQGIEYGGRGHPQRIEGVTHKDKVWRNGGHPQGIEYGGMGSPTMDRGWVNSCP